MDLSPLQIARYDYQPKLPLILKDDISEIKAVEGEATANDDSSFLKQTV